MKAVVARGIGQYAVEQVPVPEVPVNGTLLRVEGCGICAGDIKAYQGGARFWGNEEFEAYCEPPFIPGHEFVGVIEQVGPEYTGKFRPGDRVAVEQIVPCGECAYCKANQYWLCDPHNVFGFKYYLNGGFAEYVALPYNALLYELPKEMPLETALLVEPFACSCHAVDRAHLKPEDVLVIAGAGPLGLGMIGWAAQTKCRAVVAMDMFDERLERAKMMGATHVFNPGKGDPREFINSLTGGIGCDAYIEATGHPSGVTMGLQLLKKAGKMVEFSVFTAPTSCDWGLIGDAKELTIYGCSLSPKSFPATIRALSSGMIKSEGIVTHQFPLDKFQEAFAVCKSGAGVKVALVP